MNKRRIKNKKFHINKLRKRMRELRRKNKGKNARVNNRIIDAYSTSVYDFLSQMSFGNISLGERLFVKNKSGVVPIEIPEVFSVTNNMEETIKIFRTVFYYGCNDNVNTIVFVHNKCNELEIAASTVMDTIVMACKSYRRKIGKELRIAGDFPKNPKVRKMFIASGLPSHLQLCESIPYRKDNLRLFSLVSGKNGTDRSGTVSTKLTDYVNECLNTQCYELTSQGKRNISKMFCEVIDNCEIHGGENTTWYTLGYFDMMNKKYGEMNLVIFNYGKSIYEQLISEDTTFETKKKIEYMKEIHKKQYDDNWNEETMLTVFSLQQGISRLRDRKNEGNKDRGTGTVILIDTFYKLGKTIQGEEPQFSITSGHVHILFDRKYQLQEKEIHNSILGNGKRKIIAFNNDNDILKKANSENVHCMNQFFPGTIISMKFYIDKEYLNILKGE